MQSIAAIQIAIFNAGISYTLYKVPPATVKKSITGDPHAIKSIVSAAVIRIFDIKKSISYADETDAIATATWLAMKLTATPVVLRRRKQ